MCTSLIQTYKSNREFTHTQNQQTNKKPYNLTYVEWLPPESISDIDLNLVAT